ncbi:MAG TPA: hypothetical protein VI457_07520 [Methylococcaceae bacterium]|nr:hypothetical protein [Methylococcaceae bacterium]
MRKTYEAVFYSPAHGGPEEHRIQGTANSLAEAKRLAKNTASMQQWRLVEVYELDGAGADIPIAFKHQLDRLFGEKGGAA